ncbi:MAG: preprotein translocase subunit SecA [Omnitrophica bacterium]|nr:preprotein translocase subunit SecA [Candidatus Omnitrophota bacterium]
MGSESKRELARLRPLVDKINGLEEAISKLSEEELGRKTDEFKERVGASAQRLRPEIDEIDKKISESGFPQEKDKLRLKRRALNNKIFEDILPEAFAVVREVARRKVGMRHFDVQLVGGLVMHEGKIVEMATGEGKTLVATLPAYLNALAGGSVHIVTVNDYLAGRDREWMGPIYEFLGMTVGVIQHDMSPEERKKSYACDIVYGTNNEFGFDYLRDNMVIRAEDIVQGEFNFAIVDEVDSILIDESRTPLIISGPTESTNTAYAEMKPVVDEVSRLQSRLIRELLAKLKSKVNNKEDEEEIKKLLYIIHKGSPKEKEFLDLVLKNTKIKALFDKTINLFESKLMEDERGRFLEELFFIFDEKTREVTFTSKGEDMMRKRFNVEFIIEDLETKLSEIPRDASLSDEEIFMKENEITAAYVESTRRVDSIKQLLKAYVLFRLDVDYVIQDNKIVIVDEFTGRMMPGRRFSEGIHESIEAKEGVEVQRESQTLATITLQNFFRMYKKLSGMTGTALTEASEFEKIYGLQVVDIPPNRALRRTNISDIIYKTEREKFNAICDKIESLHEKGRPVLVGTISIEKSEHLSDLLKKRSIPHYVLNAKYHEMEAHIITQAGRYKAITIATNMAGRGTDIILGGNPEYLAEDAVNKLSPESPEERKRLIKKYMEEYKIKTDEEHKRVVKIGGLHVIGTERHESRRIDNQLRGRAGRQGDPGSSGFYLSLEDDLMRIFGSDRIKMIMERLGMEEGQEIQHPLVARAVRTAQKRVEMQNFEIRKHLLKYDNVMNQQRELIYAKRRSAILEDNLREEIFDILDAVLDDWLSAWEDTEGFLSDFCGKLRIRFLLNLDPRDFSSLSKDGIIKKILEMAGAHYAKKEKILGEEKARALEKMVFLGIIDSNWKDYLFSVDSLREGIMWRSYGQRDPLIEYQREAFDMFANLIKTIDEETLERIFKAFAIEERFTHGVFRKEEEIFIHEGYSALQKPPEEKALPSPMPDARPAKEMTYRRKTEKVGRNEPCPCGSGLKYKKCCGK